MSDHNKCPFSKKEHEKCIFRLSYFHRIQPSYIIFTSFSFDYIILWSCNISYNTCNIVASVCRFVADGMQCAASVNIIQRCNMNKHLYAYNLIQNGFSFQVRFYLLFLVCPALQRCGATVHNCSTLQWLQRMHSLCCTHLPVKKCSMQKC